FEGLPFSCGKDYPVTSGFERVGDNLECRCERAPDLAGFQPDLKAGAVVDPAPLIRKQEVERRDLQFAAVAHSLAPPAPRRSRQLWRISRWSAWLMLTSVLTRAV